jgi:hypothetical protein
VFDILGKQVAELIDETKPAGNHEVVFNGQDLTSGIYILTIKAGSLDSNGDFQQTIKLTLLK